MKTKSSTLIFRLALTSAPLGSLIWAALAFAGEAGISQCQNSDGTPTPALNQATQLLQQGTNLAGFFQPTGGRTDALKFASLLRPQVAGEELPGAFHRPWEWPESNYDPAFRASYYSDKEGVLNVPSAPWNLIQAVPWNPFGQVSSGSASPNGQILDVPPIWI